MLVKKDLGSNGKLEPRKLAFQAISAPKMLCAGTRGRIFVFPDGQDLHRLMIVAPTEKCAGLGVQIVPRGTQHFLHFSLTHAVGSRVENPDWIAVLSEPFELSSSALLTFVESGKHIHVADIAPATGIAWPLQLAHWIPVYGRPYTKDPERTIDAHEVSRQNFAALRAAWPLLKECRFELNDSAKIAVPSQENRHRVMGKGALQDADGSVFVRDGRALVTSVLNIADTYDANTLSGQARILDWGVGCGRMARHIPAALQRRFCGVDVDPVNIKWCKQNLPFGTYETVDPYTSTAFKDHEFKLIYSHSVLTHLSEADQFFWLKELARICSGLMVLSVNGTYHAATVASWGAVPHAWFDWLERGYESSLQPLPDISDVVEEGYYTGAAHTPRYIRDKWSSIVEVVDILPGGFGRQHDAVVCRPKTK